MDQWVEAKDPVLELIGFSLSDCLADVEESSLKYLPAVHRTALQVAIPNLFGADIGGYWLMAEQVTQLRELSEYYGPKESLQVADVIEAYLRAQLWSAPAERSGDGHFV